MTLEELLALWNDETTRADMTAEQLDELRAALEAHARELLDGERTDDTLADLEQIAVTVEAVDAAITERAEAAAAAEQQAADLASRIFGQDGDEPEPESEEEPEAGTPSEPVEGAPEPEPAPAEGDEPVETPADEAAEPIAASVAFTPRITNVNARRPASARPRASASRAPSALVASANMGGNIAAGQVLDTPEMLSAAFLAAWDASKGFKNGRQKISVARSGGDPLELYGEDRFLDGNARLNSRKIEAVCGRDAIVAAAASLTAAGGPCVPPPVSYDVPIIEGTEARPVRDEMLVRFGADRAGIRTLPAPILTDLSNAVTDWSMANDIEPGSDGPAEKECLTITCPAEVESTVDAIVRCLRVGNFRSRFFGEQVQAWLDLAAVWHARHAERKLLVAIGAASTQVTVGQILGTSRDILTSLDRAVPQFQSRHRTATTFPLRWAAPFWLRNQWRADIARQMPVGTVDETLAFADAQIERELAVRNVLSSWFLDGEPGQEFGPQGDGPLNGWPNTVVSYLYPEGTHQFLDGGMFDFGIMRDTETTKTNDFQVFAETLEGHHMSGIESLRIAHDVCPDGSASALVDISPCAVGS